MGFQRSSAGVLHVWHFAGADRARSSDHDGHAAGGKLGIGASDAACHFIHQKPV